MTTQVQGYTQLLESVPCNLCGANDYSVIYPARYDLANPKNIMASFRSSADEILVDQLVKCNRCGLQYLNPRLNQDLIIDAYSSGTDETFVSQAPGREKTFAKSLDFIEKYCPAKGKILDIGTAGGSFLHVARQRGWKVRGCEPNRWLCQWAKDHYGLDVTPGTVWAMDVTENEFDVITLWDVLEHVPDPTKLLRECHRILKPGGLLVVNYPDIEASVSKVLGRKWVFLLSVHLFYFTVPTILKVLEKNGFRLLRCKNHWQTLEIDYILFRMKPYIPWLSDFGRHVVKTLRLQHMQIPYFMGQRFVLEQKDKR